MQSRTDLALESYETHDKTKIDGVIVRESGNLTTVRITNENGMRALSKPMGDYITLKVKSFVNDTDIFDGRLDEFSSALESILPKKLSSVLVVGLGNKNITADSLGPKVSGYVFPTRHIIGDLKRSLGFDTLFPVSSINTGVLGDTGIETAEIIRGVSNQVKPSCIIAVDALTSSSMDRLGNTVQFSNNGISPGSGVGNHRSEISEKTIGVPVISIGIPTVVSTSVINSDDTCEAYVTPREIDRISEQGAKLIGMGINVCFQKSMTCEDLYALVG